MKNSSKKSLPKAQPGKEVMRKTANKTVSKVTSPSGNYKTTTKTFTSPNKEGSVTKTTRTIKGLFAGAPTVDNAKQERKARMEGVEKANKKIASENEALKLRQQYGYDTLQKPRPYKTVKHNPKYMGDFKKGGTIKKMGKKK